MTLGEFLSDRLGRIFMVAACAGGAALFLLATGTQPGIIVILLLVFLPVLCMVQMCDFFRCRAHLKELAHVMEGLDRKYLFFECVSGSRSLYERRLFDLCRQAGQSMTAAVSEAQAAKREYREYVEGWVHEIKAPITAAGLICRNTDSEIRRRLSGELSQIEAHVERALFYARAESPEKDFLIRQAELEEIVSRAVEQHRTLLIQSGVRVETSGLEETVFTDGKWAAFILGQLLQNAARYRREEPVITLSAMRHGREVQLTVRDNGMGIPSYELPRVFERGFTGSNGRARGGSTGMGLYLCRKLADCLGIGLQIASAEGRETAVTLIFPAKGNLTES